MGNEELTLLTWALQHPRLYTLIKMKHSITVLGLFGIIKTMGSIYLARLAYKKK